MNKLSKIIITILSTIAIIIALFLIVLLFHIWAFFHNISFMIFGVIYIIIVFCFVGFDI